MDLSPVYSNPCSPFPIVPLFLSVTYLYCICNVSVFFITDTLQIHYRYVTERNKGTIGNGEADRKESMTDNDGPL
jgi:hypothetical protein